MTNSYLLRGGSAKASTTTRDSGSAADTWQITIMVNNFNQHVSLCQQSLSHHIQGLALRQQDYLDIIFPAK